ncbi:hypothetical protein ZWY2020_052961 [Hordeum vulgare]|nr:hypothetical protein ZWY2020_052961 [Hordeum vulgare]
MPPHAAVAARGPRMGDPTLRPTEDFVVVHASAEMQAESALLSSNGAVVWLDGARRDVPCRQVADELAVALGALKADVDVVKHYPEQFFVRFMHQHHCALAVSREHLLGAGHTIFVREWRLEAHADNEDQLHHVRLSLEGVPLHAWNNYIATFLIGRGCSLDYIEPRSLRKEDTRDLALWAWTADPSSIPKVKWLTLPARGQRRCGCQGLRHCVIIHLDIHEDHSKESDEDETQCRRKCTSSPGTATRWMGPTPLENGRCHEMKLLAVLIDATTMTIGMGGADGVIVGLGRAGAQECDTHSPATLATGAAKMPRNVIVTALEANDASMKTLLLLPLLPRCCGGQALAATSYSAMWSFCPSKGRCRLYQGDAVR